MKALVGRGIRSLRDSWRRAYRWAPPVTPERGGDLDGRSVIGFANDMFGGKRDLHRIDGPTDVLYSSHPDEVEQADVVVFHVPTLRRLPHRKPSGQRWVAWSFESVANHPRLGDPRFRARFDLTMTYETTSDVPLSYASYYDGRLGELLLRPLEPVHPRELGASFISSKIDRSGRIRWQRELARRLPLHCYGRVGRNRTLDGDDGRPSKIETLRRYELTLAFENSVARDYVTEKFYDPLIVGSIPVYLGAPNVDELAPGDRCFVDVSRFRGSEELAGYLRHLSTSESERATYQEWRARPLRPRFVEILERSRLHPFERLARRLLAGPEAP